MTLKDELLSSLDRLAINSSEIQISSKKLLYSAWISKPIPSFLHPGQSKEELAEILETGLKIDLGKEQMPILKSRNALPQVITITPFANDQPPDPKPNMLMALASILYYEKKLAKGTPSAAELVSLIGQKYDIVMPRRPLKSIISLSTADFQTFAFRPSKTAPLFIDRVESYSSNPGAIGHQFEVLMVDEPKEKFYRSYGVFDVRLSHLKLLITGEVDGISKDLGNPIEIKTKPAWLLKDKKRLQTWAQCVVSDVETVVTAGFSAQKGVRNGPVTFQTSSNIIYEPFKRFSIPEHEREEGKENTLNILTQVLAECDKVGCVYRVSGSADGKVSCQKLRQDEKYDFPISQNLIDDLSELIADKEQ